MKARWTQSHIAQADLSLRWAHTRFVGFLMLWLTFYLGTLTQPNEVQGYISTICYFDVTCIDDKISWNPVEEIIYVSVNSTKLWVPNLIVSSPADRICAFHEISQELIFTDYVRAVWILGTAIKLSATCRYLVPFRYSHMSY